MAGRTNFVGNLYRGDQYYLCTERDRPAGAQLVHENVSLTRAKELVSSLVLIIAGVRYSITSTRNTFKFIANAGRVMPCLINDAYKPSPIVQLFYEGRMSFPVVFPGNFPIFDTSEQAYDEVKSRALAGKVEDADLYMRDKYKITYMKLVENLGNKLKVRIYYPTMGYGSIHVISGDDVYLVELDFEKVMQDFLRDSMLDVWEFNACNKQELLNQYKDLSPVELANLRLERSLQQSSLIRRNRE